MREKLFYVLVFGSIVFYCCKEDKGNPAGIDQNNTQLTPYFLGDTSGYTDRPRGFIVLRQFPSIILHVSPQNPEYARINKISGKIYTHYCVTKEGAVRGVVVDSTENEIFNRPTLEAVVQWQFTPAIGVDSLPMEIWQFAPFSFTNN